MRIANQLATDTRSTMNSKETSSGMDKRIKSRSRRPLYIGAAAIAAVALGILAYGSFDSSTSFTLDGQRIRIAEVARGRYEDYIPLRASVEPERTTYLDAIEGGRVEAVLVEEGGYVDEGQPLIELSNTTLQLDVIAREAEISEQLNNLRNTELAIEQNRLQLKSELIEIDYQIVRLERLVTRYEQLEDQQFLSRNEYEDSVDELAYWQNRRTVTRESQAQDEKVRRVQIEQLQNSVGQLERNLKLASANLDNLTIEAPRSSDINRVDRS